MGAELIEHDMGMIQTLVRFFAFLLKCIVQRDLKGVKSGGFVLVAL
jgi:hypothetical protein